MIKIDQLACPFCGKSNTLEIFDVSHLSIQVGCNFNAGGCGGSGGARDSHDEAIQAFHQHEQPFIHVDGWMSYDKAESLKNPLSFSGLGGFFDGGMRFNDYQKHLGIEALPHVKAFRQHIIENNIRRGGDFHQDSESGVPVFSDGTVFRLYMRAWGDLMAAIWSDKDNKDYSCLDFYMDGYSGKPGAAEKPNEPE